MQYTIKSCCSLFFLLVLLLAHTYTHAQSNAQNRCNAFGKGQNLSNWLEATWDNTWPSTTRYTKWHLQKMKEAGIQSLRLPIQFAKITDTIAPYNVDENHALFSRIDTIIAWCNELDLMLIIDNHHGWQITNSNWRTQQQRFAHLWSVVAKRYQYLDPNRFTFELLNEPGIPSNGALDNDSLSSLLTVAIDSIRQHTTAHSIIVSPSFGSWGLAYESYTPLADSNLIYTWHLYDPINFTHQGFSWNTPFYPAGLTYPSAGNVYEPALALSWQHIVQWKNTYNKPIFLGEFGVSHFADAQSKCNWIEYVGTQILQHNISWFYWDWAIDFSMFQSGSIDKDSITPCFKRALRLYGDTSFTSIQNSSGENISFTTFPTLLHKGTPLLIETNYEKEYTAELLNIIGNSLAKKQLSGFKNTIETNLPSGLYFLFIDVEKQRIVKRIVIQ